MGTKGRKRKKVAEIALFSTLTHCLKPQRKIKTFFRLFSGLFFWSVGAQNFSKYPDPSKNQQIAISRNTQVKPPNIVRVRQLRNTNAVPMSQNIPGNSPVAPSYGGNGFFVGWVPNRQNRSATDEMAPSAPRNGHIPGPRITWDPKQGSLGPHLACKQLWSGGEPNGAAKCSMGGGGLNTALPPPAKI